MSLTCSLPAKGRGFTLIEMLVVVFIISIMALLTTLNISGNHSSRVVDQAAYRLTQIIHLIAQTAILEQTDLGLGLWRTGYGVWRYDPIGGQWQILQHERVLTAHTLPASLNVGLFMDNNRQNLPEFTQTLQQPQLWFSASGAASPATITLTAGQQTVTLTIENNGNVTAQRAK